MKDFLPVLKNVFLFFWCCVKSFFIRLWPNTKHFFRTISETIKYRKKIIKPYIKAIKLRWVFAWLGCVALVGVAVIVVLSLTTDYYILTYKGYNLGYLRNTEMAESTLVDIKNEFKDYPEVAEDIDTFEVKKIKIGNIFLKCMDKDEFRDIVIKAADTIEYAYHVYLDDEYIMSVAGTDVVDNALLDFKNDRITISEDINSKYDKCDIKISNEVTTKRVCMLVKDITTNGSYQGLYSIFEERISYRIECLQTVPESIPYMTYYRRNDKLESGATKVVHSGANGVKNVQSKVIVENGELVSNTVVKETVVKKAVLRRIDIGNNVTDGVSGGIALLFPIDAYLTSDFGYRPDPFTGETAFHSGLDLGATKGTPIQAAAGGKVIQASDKKNGYGKCVIIEHPSGFRTLYAHCSELNVKVGEYVTAGQIIAKVGSTGRSTGPHLHFSIIIDGDYVDPKLYF